MKKKKKRINKKNDRHEDAGFLLHYKNMPIQIYWKFYNQKEENFQIKNSDIFHISALKHRLLVLVRTASPRRF